MTYDLSFYLCIVRWRHVAWHLEKILRYKVELREVLGYRRDVLEDGTNILCRNAGGGLLIDAKQHNGKN